MSQDQAMGILRHILTIGAGVAISKGWIDEETSLQVIGGIVAIVGIWWSVKSKQSK
jgi:hypothetical protein